MHSGGDFRRSRKLRWSVLPLRVRPYRWLADYYDLIFQVPAGFTTARKKILRPLWPQIQIACDLACGTGRTLVELAGRGVKVYGVDLSAGMCRAARTKLRKHGLQGRVFQADMRDFLLPEPVDLVTCEFDALNHIPEREDLAKVADAVSAALRPGGHFFFDVNNRGAFLNTWDEVWWNDLPGVAMVMHGGHEDSGLRAWCDVEWFVEEKNGLWRRHREHVEEVCWSEAEMRRALKSAGFDRVDVWDGYPFFRTRFYAPGYRSFYLARKRDARSVSKRRR